MKTHLTLAVLLVAGHVRAASAEGDVGDPLTMDRLTPVSTFGIDLGFPLWDTEENTSLTTLGITAAGHYVDRGSGFGGYLSVPLAFISYEADLIIGEVDDSELSIGNVEVGGMFAKWFGRVAVVAHVGLAAPTSTADTDEAVGALQPLASAPRYADLVQRVPDSTWLRLGASPMGREGKLFWRGDFGLDFAIDDDNDDSLSPIWHLNVGGGIDLGSAALQAELVTVITDSEGDDTNSVLALGARFHAGNVRPGLALLIPIEWDDFDWDLGFGFSLAARL